jgi:hypothetical protein
MRGRHVAASDGDRAAVPAEGGTHELLLVARAPQTADGRTAVVERTDALLARAAPAGVDAADGRVLAIGGRVEARAAEIRAGAPAAPIDLDALVDRAWHKLMLRVTIERERRGYTRWPWQS